VLAGNFERRSAFHHLVAKARGGGKLLKSLEHQAAGAVFAVEPQLFFLQDAEGFTGEVGFCRALAVCPVVERVGDFFPRVQDVFKLSLGQIGGVKDIAQLLAVQTVK